MRREEKKSIRSKKNPEGHTLSVPISRFFRRHFGFLAPFPHHPTSF